MNICFSKLAIVAALVFGTTAFGQKEVSISAIQGSGLESAYKGQQVRTSGVVTARIRNGFFLQSPDDKADADPNTSEGIFVFTGPRNPPPADAAVGSLVTVSGEVEEFRRSNEPLSSTITEISHRVGTNDLKVVSKTAPLPKPVTIEAKDLTANSIDQFERFEGMRITFPALTVVGPTGGSEDEKTGLWQSDGVFFAVTKGTPRPFREPGLDIREFNAARERLEREVPKLPVFDFNPETIRVDMGEQTSAESAQVLNLPSGAEVSGLTGVLHFTFGRATLLTDPASKPGLAGGIKGNPLPATTDRQFSVAGMNVENFFDDQDDAGIREPVPPPDAFDRRLKKISYTIRELMKTPDVIGLVEIENLKALKRLADRINADAVAAGKPDPKYEAYLTEGNDGRGIDNGLLVKTSRVSVLEVKQFGKDEKYKNPDTGQDNSLNDRTPMMLRASVPDDKAGKPFEFTVVVNHLKSYSGFNDPRQMANVRMKKKLQAEFLAKWAAARQKANAGERIILIGDFNSYQFSDGVLDMIGTIKGKPSAKDSVMNASDDLVDPDLMDLVDVIAAGQRYSYIFDGNAQALDHMLVTENLTRNVMGFGFLRVNADYPESMRNDAARPERFSDHDPAVGYFSLDARAAPAKQ
jgi:predicted extracellular nuclease